MPGCLQQVVLVVRRLCRVVHNRLCLVVHNGLCWLLTGCAGCPQRVVLVVRRLCVGCAGLSTTGCAGLSTTGCAGCSLVVPGCPQRVVQVVRLQLSDLYTPVYGGGRRHTKLLIPNRRTTCCAGCAQHVVPARTTFYPPYKTDVFTHLATESKY